MHPVICSIGPFTVYSWGLMVAIAFIVGLFVGLYFSKKEGLETEKLYDLFIFVVIASIVGARLFYVIGFFPQYAADPISILLINQGGLVFLGGFAAAFAVVLIFVWLHGIPLWKLLDAMSPAVMIGYSIGRIGCFLNGCCYGITIFGFQQPTQIYSSLAGLVMFLLLAFLYGRKKYDGHIFLLALLFYSVYRFFIEFIRFSPIHYSVFTANQFLCVIVFLSSLYGLWIKRST
jgi:phosphatidylglycerol:prolipoprotein diacylglycerol transferase